MDYAIEAIVKLTADIYFGGSIDEAREIYLHGGCYEFLKIIKEFVPDIVFYIHKENQHCVFSFEGNLYDANGVINSHINDYKVADEKEKQFMESTFGNHIKGLQLYKNITFEIRKKTLVGFLQMYMKQSCQSFRRQSH